MSHQTRRNNSFRRTRELGDKARVPRPIGGVKASSKLSIYAPPGNRSQKSFNALFGSVNVETLPRIGDDTLV
jgi:hypothetical protein